MFFVFVFGINKDVIKVHYYKNIELPYQDFINIALEHDQCIGQSKKHYLVLKMALAALESHLLFITFPDPHSIVGVGKIELGKILSSI